MTAPRHQTPLSGGAPTLRPRPARLPAPAVAALAALVTMLALVGPAQAFPAVAAPADPLSAPGVLVAPGTPAPAVPQAGAWLVADLDTGEVLAAQNATAPLAPASTIKVLTALSLGRDLDPQARYTAVHEDAAIDGSKVGLVPGSVYRVQDLLHGLMLGSGNDAASALAQIAGGHADAVATMQATADALGATETVVRNPSGLDADGQVSTARDLALISRAALAEPWLAELVTTRTYKFPGVGTTFDGRRPYFEIANHNRLVFNYPGALGVKNGYTNTARGSFVGAVERDGRRYVAVVMRAEGPTWRSARDLLDWALLHGDTTAPVGDLGDAGRSAEADAGRSGGDARAVSSTGVPDGSGAGASGAGGSGAGGSGRGAAAADAAPATAPGPQEPDGAGWWQGVGVVLLVLAMAVVGLRTRVLLRRARRTGRARTPAAARPRVSPTSSGSRRGPSGPPRPRP